MKGENRGKKEELQIKFVKMKKNHLQYRAVIITVAEALLRTCFQFLKTFFFLNQNIHFMNKVIQMFNIHVDPKTQRPPFYVLSLTRLQMEAQLNRRFSLMMPCLIPITPTWRTIAGEKTWCISQQFGKMPVLVELLLYITYISLRIDSKSLSLGLEENQMSLDK